MFAKARQALHTSAPSSIVGREKELQIIKSFLQSSLEDGKSGCMYICGRPGTGKTACVNYLLTSSQVSLQTNQPISSLGLTFLQVKGHFQTIFINCMLLTTQNAIYHHIAKHFDPQTTLKGKEALVFIEEVLTDPGPMM